MSAPTSDELQLIQIFRRRVSSFNTADLLEIQDGQSSDQNLLRWIRARECDLDKAEEMIRKHLEWRKRNGIGPSLLDWTPPDYLTETYAVKFLGFDPSSGSPILFLNFGSWDIRKALERGLKEQLVRYKDQVLEQIMALMRVYENWARKGSSTRNQNVTQFIALCDWNGFSLRYIMNKEAVEVILESARSFEANYPETLKAGFNVNCPKVFTVLFNLVKPFLSERTLSKIYIFDHNALKWKPELLKTVPASHLPSVYGGLEENTKMYTLHQMILSEDDETVVEALKQSTNSFATVTTASNNSNGFGSMKFTNVKVSPGYKVHLPCNNSKSPGTPLRVGSRISWHFTVEEKDIGFSIVFFSSEDSTGRGMILSDNSPSSHLIKYERVEQDLGSVICEKIGTYLLCFDNTFSTFKPKIVSYKVLVDDPFSID